MKDGAQIVTWLRVIAQKRTVPAPFAHYGTSY